MNSLNKYDKYIDQFGQGFVAGVLSSLETTLINIWGGWAKRGGRGGRATHAWVLHFSCPLRDLARFLTERTQAAERARERPGGASSSGRGL